MLVVCAAIIDKGELLAARRMSPSELAGKYELPGGKVEDGEDPRAALSREIAEELSCEIEVEGEPFFTQKVSRRFKTNTFLFYRAHLLGARPLRSTDHDALVWLPKKSWLSGVEWIDVDLDAITTLTELNQE